MTIAEWIEKRQRDYLGEAHRFLCERGLCERPEDMQALYHEWDEHIAAFDAQNPAEFYASWTGRRGASAICRNIVDQFERTYVLDTLFFLFGGPSDFAGRILDYGCGTAALSMACHRFFFPRARLYLADVENLTRDFLECVTLQRENANVCMTGLALEEVRDNSLDVVLCIDVLEHLQNPSVVFELLDRKLRSGGLMVLQAPWGGHTEHLEEAPEDWERNGGQGRLEARYVEMFRMAEALPLSGVFWKRLIS